MRVRRVFASVRWAFRESVTETIIDIEYNNFKRLCEHCVVRAGPNCPRKSQLMPHYENMTAVVCDIFVPILSKS